MFKVNEHWIMIRRKPVAYAMALMIVVVGGCIAYGFMTFPDELKLGVMPRLNEMSLKQTQEIDQIKLYIQNIIKYQTWTSN